MQTSGAMRRENAESHLRRMGRAKRNPSPVRSETIHLSVREVTMDCFASPAMTGMGRSAEYPTYAGYEDPLAPRKIRQALQRDPAFTDASHAHVKGRF